MKSRHCTFESPLPAWLAATPPVTTLSALYGAVIRQRNCWYDRHPGHVITVRPPVISVGGIRAGGTGKTPTVMLLAELLHEQGFTVGVLSRGYKRSKKESLIVAPDEHANWEDTGDEPAMMKNACPYIWLGIGSDRAANAAQLQERIKINPVLLLDDGFQHRKLHRDCNIVCIHQSLFSDRLLPRGYLREPPESLGRADVFLLIGTAEPEGAMNAVGERLSALYPSTPQFILVQKAVAWVNARTRDEAAVLPLAAPVALSGIARPERFFNLVEAQGVKIYKKMAFPDHYRYTDYDISLLRKLYSHGLITTEKDAVRLSSLAEIPEGCLWYLKVRLQFSENRSFKRFNHYIKAVLDRKRSSNNMETNPI